MASLPSGSSSTPRAAWLSSTLRGLWRVFLSPPDATGPDPFWAKLPIKMFVPSANDAYGGSHQRREHMELRVPHILWICLFWSIVMMFVAENFLP
jgi:hypothetical protein